MYNSVLNCIPNNLKLLLPHDSFHLVLMVSVLYFFFPIHTTLVLSKFILRPEYFAWLDSTLSVSFNEVDEPSNITDVSSAYCDNLYSVLLICVVIPLIFLLSPAFSKKSGGTLFLVFRGAWGVVRGSEFLVGTLSP